MPESSLFIYIFLEGVCGHPIYRPIYLLHLYVLNTVQLIWDIIVIFFQLQEIGKCGCLKPRKSFAFKSGIYLYKTLSATGLPFLTHILAINTSIT